MPHLQSSELLQPPLTMSSVVTRPCTEMNWLTMEKCCFMSVAITRSTTVLRSLRKSLPLRPSRKKQPGERSRLKAAAAWWLSIGDLVEPGRGGTQRGGGQGGRGVQKGEDEFLGGDQTHTHTTYFGGVFLAPTCHCI